MSFRFGSFVLDTRRYELRSGETVVHVEPQVFDVLAYLVTHRDRVVGKDELLDEIWGSRFVTESSLTSRIKAARRAIGDDGSSQTMIQTVRGRGFRFIAPTAEDREAGAHDEDRLRPPRPDQVPTVLGSLIGRADELAGLIELLSKTRLVTVVGPGGVGKTRCAIDAGRRAADELGVHLDFVDLAPADGAGGVARAISEASGLRVDGARSPVDSLCSGLRHERRLLLLDNFEHVLDAAPVVAAVLETAPEVRVLVTSRERLRLAGEQVFPLDALTWDAAEGPAPALELFESAARRLEPGFCIDDDNREDVVALCRAVDGLPLGIELIAAYVRLMSPRQLRLQLGHRISSLPGDLHGLPARQRTLRDTVDWSLQLLSEPEREFLTRLSCFRADADLDAIDEVCSRGLGLDSVAAVAALTDKSLLRRRTGADGSPRFSMLELVREGAGELLDASGHADAARDHHAAYHHDLVRDVEERRWVEFSESWMGTLDERYADIETALEYDFTLGDPVRGARTVAGLSCYWHRAWRLTEGARWSAQAFDAADPLEPLDRGLLHEGEGYLCFRTHRLTEARRHFRAALESFEAVSHHRYRALAKVDLAGTWMGDRAGAAAAIELCLEGVRESREVGDAPLIAHAVNVLGELTHLAGDTDTAWTANLEGLHLARGMGDQMHQAIFEMNLSTLAVRRAAREPALEFARAALRRAAVLGGQVMIAHGLYTAAAAELEHDRPDVAARLYGAAQALFDALDVTPGPGDRPEYRRVHEDLESSLGPARLAECIADGRRWSTHTAVAQALG